MTTPIDGLAGIVRAKHWRADNGTCNLDDADWPCHVAVLGLALDAARSTPVPASNVSEGLRTAIDSVANALNDLDLYYAVDGEHPTLHRDWDVVRLAALAHAAPEGLPDELGVGNWPGGGGRVSKYDDATWVNDGGGAWVLLYAPRQFYDGLRRLPQPDATEEARRAAANPDDPSHESAIRYLADPDWQPDATEEAER